MRKEAPHTVPFKSRLLQRAKEVPPDCFRFFHCFQRGALRFRGPRKTRIRFRSFVTGSCTRCTGTSPRWGGETSIRQPSSSIIIPKVSCSSIIHGTGNGEKCLPVFAAGRGAGKPTQSCVVFLVPFIKGSAIKNTSSGKQRRDLGFCFCDCPRTRFSFRLDNVISTLVVVFCLSGSRHSIYSHSFFWNCIVLCRWMGLVGLRSSFPGISSHFRSTIRLRSTLPLHT